MTSEQRKRLVKAQDELEALKTEVEEEMAEGLGRPLTSKGMILAVEYGGLQAAVKALDTV